ncbi:MULTISPECIES: hypothetical protein [unclassified Nitratiruptor]|uniref:hypothetical protein n=1 Tax=unclassified Nitratiruptor TaxID=2624044 RepID=UPI0019164937|nr:MULTISPECIES: hypothetical protein [unclassified Nitratiruptor]BCD60616.1 hypothetical protein NitYY0810_C1391 [Nitratiruptor sp. YY08-10]BCD64547.1 hypothetical protein NitYY0814_C1398 [Nitratiruptor sp. YY08-14]
MKKEKFTRSKYIRELERFVNRIVDFFNKKEPTKQEIVSFLDTIFKPLETIEKTYLSSEYLKSLEKFVEKNANIGRSDKSAQELREDVLKEANLLRKLKRKRRFTKEKHKKDWEEA